MSTLVTVFSLYRERKRQLHEEGWTTGHDDKYKQNELGRAAASYLTHNASFWPWAHRFYKLVPDNRIRELEKAGALIVAEIERLKREKKINGYSARHNLRPQRPIRGSTDGAGAESQGTP